jgi:hypothetical protein
LEGWLQHWKLIAEASQATLTGVAIVVAGIWTYRLFVKQREPYPKANVEHRVAHWKLGERTVVRLTVRITNVSGVVLSLPILQARLQQLLPMSSGTIDELLALEVPTGESEIPWPLLAERTCDWSDALREVEPGETEECHFDFLIASDVAAVMVYSYLKNHSKRGREIGWNTTTVCSLRTGGLDGHQEDVVSSRSGSAKEESAAPTAAKEGEAVNGQVDNEGRHQL